MCGLIGSFQFQAHGQLNALVNLHQRGPEVEGHWFSSDARCWLAHARLPIQDLPDSNAQPITSHCGRFTLVFSGEIYNHQQVRKGLRFDAWRGSSDRETLVEGLAQRGPALLLELRGMFAFAAYDKQKEQLLLARDRLGIKPLYLSWQPKGLFFASERRFLSGGHCLDQQSLSQVLVFGYQFTPAQFPGPETEGTVSLPAGTVVRINHDRPHDPVRYWPPQPRPDWTPLPIRSHRWARRFLREQLQEVVAQHLVADVPVACLLSSGLDRGILTALACRQLPGLISTFTVLLPGSSEDESAFARQMARHCGSDHHELNIQNEDALAWVEQALVALDVPTAVAINTFLISRAVADQGIKLALSGLGANELFGGNPSHRLMPWLHLLKPLPPRIRQGVLQRLSSPLADKLSGLPRWDRWHLGLALRRLVNDPDLNAACGAPLQWPESPPQRITQAWGQTSWAELFGFTEPMLLRDSDVLRRACGLELRVPFLDHQLVEIALRMPQRYQKHGKGLLLQACADLFPAGYLNCPKQGFALPMDAWMRGPLREFCLGRLETLQQADWLDPSWIHRQWHAFDNSRLHWARAWNLVVLGEFARRYTLP